jgi:aspartyl-tRNA(Asn)/glutamyl-tRNA(Gln) amidotransferase subunit A
MAGEARWQLEAAPLAGLRVGVAQGMPMEDLDQTVAARFPAALARLEKAGCRLSSETTPLFDEMLNVIRHTSILVAEVYSIHRERLAERGDTVDPIVRGRIEKGRDIAAADYIRALRERARLIRAMDARLADLDVLAMPATPTVAPLFDEVDEPRAFMARNALLLRNTTIGNFFDLCAVSVPMPRDEGLPCGLMLLARNGHDRRLLRIAAAVEQAFA